MADAKTPPSAWPDNPDQNNRGEFPRDDPTDGDSPGGPKLNAARSHRVREQGGSVSDSPLSGRPTRRTSVVHRDSDGCNRGAGSPPQGASQRNAIRRFFYPGLRPVSTNRTA